MHPLVPYLVFHSSTSFGFASAFNLIPTPLVSQYNRLQQILCIPLHLNFVPSEKPEHFSGYVQTPAWHFQTDENKFFPSWPLNTRGVLLWTSSIQSGQLLEDILSHDPLFVLVISESNKILELLRHVLESSKIDQSKFSFQLAINNDGLYFEDLPVRIWKKYLLLLAAVFPNDSDQPDVFESKHRLTIKEQLHLANEFHYSSGLQTSRRLDIVNDLIVNPNQIVLNIFSGHITTFNFTKTRTRPETHSVEVAKELVRMRAFQSLYRKARELSDQIPGATNSELLIHRWLGEYCSQIFIKAIIRRLKLPPQQRGLTPSVASIVDALPFSTAKQFIAPQFLLVCPSASLVAFEEVKTRQSSETFTPLNPPKQFRSEVGRTAIQTVSKGGRRFKLTMPPDAEDRKTVMEVAETVKAETNYLTAASLRIAIPFACPIFKAKRASNLVFEPFKELATAFEGPNEQMAEFEIRLSNTSARCAEHSTSLIPKDYLDFFCNFSRPIIHALSDYPIELVNIDDDFLGYRGSISRIPITPGHLINTNFQATAFGGNLPNPSKDIILASTFDQSDVYTKDLWASLEKTMPMMKKLFVKRRRDLVDLLNETRPKCLIFFGHGFYDPDRDNSGLILSESLLDINDVLRLEYVPETCILIACNTGTAASTLGSLHTGFLEKGTSTLVATSFPIPRLIGLHFTKRLLHWMASPHEDGYQTDLAKAVLFARWDTRILSDFFSLYQQGVLKDFDHETIWRDFEGTLDQIRRTTPSTERSLYHSLHVQAIREVAVNHNIAAWFDGPPNRWSVTPYSLFFSTIGFPWTTLAS